MIRSTLVGLPRSRTYWFSQLLTYQDYHCFHCYPYYKVEVPEGKILLNSTCVPYSGIGGDPVIIERDLEESVDSFLKFIKVPMSQLAIESMYTHTMAALDELRAKPHLDVKYEDIDDRLEEILAYMGVELPASRVLEFQKINLQTSDDGSSSVSYNI